MVEQLSTPEPPQPTTVLFVDDDADVRKAAALLLARHGMRMLAAASPREAFGILAAEAVDVVLLDLNFSRNDHSGEEGLGALADLRAQDPHQVVVVITAHSGVGMAVAAMRAGAADFVMKPWSNARLVATLEDAAALARGRRAAAAPGAECAAVRGDEQVMILGDSSAIQRVRELVRRVAPTEASVLVLGPAGTGKSLIARAVHRASTRSDRPLVNLDVASAGDPEIEAALDAAAGATLVLEEVSAVPLARQSALLERLNRNDARLIGTSRLSKAELRAAIQPELFYRIATVEIAAPRLAEREADALLLANHWLAHFARRYGRPAKPLSPDAAAAVAAHAWPDEARGLRHAMERAAVLAEGDACQVADVMGEPEAAAAALAVPAGPDLNLERSERAMVEAALRRSSFNVSHAARELGLTRAALYRRMAKHGF